MSTITLQNLHKHFDDVTAVDGVSLEIEDGEFLVLVGPSGCGKSTLLRSISGLESVSDGQLYIGDTDVTRSHPSERNVAMVFQNYTLYPHMTAHQNITFGLDADRVPAEQSTDELVSEIATMLGISELLERKPGELSGGERQRVAIGRAIVRDPEVFLLDEPLSSLDAKLRTEMRAELAELHRKLQTTTVYVTHDQTEAMTLGHRVAVMRDGQIEQVDPPQRLYDAPQTQFVAEFIGDPGMNMLEARIETANMGVVARLDDSTVPLSKEASEVLTELGPQVTLGIRPEDVIVHTDNSTMETLPFEVSVTEPLGNSLLVRGSVGDSTLTARTDAHTSVRPGEIVPISFVSDQLHFYDSQTGEAIHHETVDTNPNEMNISSRVS